MAQSTEVAGFVERRRPGRPRCSQVEWTIKRAALELLRLQGYANLTIEGVAARAGVGKATIYRWWPTKAHLVVHAFLECVSLQFPDVSGESVREDLVLQLRALAGFFSGEEGKAITTIVGAAQSSPDLAQILRVEWMNRRRALTLETLKQGVDRGEIREDVDLELLLDLLCGPFYLALFMGHRRPDEINVEHHIDCLLDGVRPIIG